MLCLALWQGLILAVSGRTCGRNSGLSLLALKKDQVQKAAIEAEQIACAGPSHGWRIRATTTSCGWCWDVSELEFHTDQGKLAPVDYDWGDWVTDCEPVSSGNYESGSYVPGRAFDGDPGSRWGGRKKTTPYFHLGLRCNNSHVVKKVVLYSPRHSVEEIRIERLVGDVWKHVHVAYPQSHEFETIYECVEVSSTTTTTTMTTTPSAEPFVAVDGRFDRACRGANSSDNAAEYYLVKSASTLDDCKTRCTSEPRCQGIEFKSGRCEVWVRGIGASARVTGFQCLRYVEPQTRGFFPVDGGFGRACRGATKGDNSPAHYQVVVATSLRECQDACLGEPACHGIEYSRGRCELWTRAEGIGTSAEVHGFMCLHLLKGFAAVDGGQDRVCRGASASDNFGSYFEVIQSSGIQSCAAACAEQKCQGIEFSPGRCEIWVRPEGIGATASLRGSVCLRRLGTAVTAKGFSFFKFVPMTLRHNGIADAVAISELSLYKEGKVLDARNAVASNLNGETSLEEGPEKAFDNDNSSKWLDKNFSDLMLQFPQPVEIDAFSFTTANDHSQRDPLQWALMGSTDGTEWSNMHLQLMDYETPKERLAQSHSFSLQPGQWAIRIRTNHTNTGWMWLVYGLEMTTGDGALVEPNAVCSAFDSETAFDGGAEQPWFAEKSGAWQRHELRTEESFWFGLQCNCPQEVRKIRFLQKCSGHFADVVFTEEFKNGAWQVLSVTEATCDDWTDLYTNASPMPAEEPEEPCYAPKAPSPAPPGATPIPPVIPNCTVSTSPSDGCMGVTVSEFSMPKLFAQTTGFTVRASNFCNNKFCTTPMRMSMESCYAGTERLLLAWTAHNSWDGSSQETVGYVSEFRAGTGGIELISHQELQHCSELGRISVTADCGVVSVMCRSETSPKEMGAIDFLKATEDEHGGQFGWNEEDADSMYLIEWAEGSEAQTTRPPSAIVHVNHAIGGWQYGHWEAVLDKSLSHYMIQLKTTLGGHEGAVNLAINRADWTWNRELSQGWACGTGHILANRLSYSSSLDRFARFCWTDWSWSGNGSTRDALWWGTMPQTGDREVTELYIYPRPPSYWEHAGGPTNMIELGDGWLGIAVAPDATEGLRVTIGLVSVPDEVRKCEDGIADCSFKWMDATKLPGKNEYLVGGKLAYANLQRGKDGRLFVGWAGDVGGQRAWGGYYVVEVDENANMYGKVLFLNNTGWGEDNPWTALQSGCIAMPFTWDEVPGHDYGNGGEDGGGGFSQILRISVLCPPATRGARIQ